MTLASPAIGTPIRLGCAADTSWYSVAPLRVLPRIPCPHLDPSPRPRKAPADLVRETVCKTILNRSGLGGYSLNCYTGCTHACVYCYARFMQRFHPHQEPWGAFVDVKVNAVETLKRQLRRAEPGRSS